MTISVFAVLTLGFGLMIAIVIGPLHAIPFAILGGGIMLGSTRLAALGAIASEALVRVGLYLAA